tara:strand:+ start:108 stop:2168 length:2061 start_codon:yes stop_codon:yes gene_type:complete
MAKKKDKSFKGGKASAVSANVGSGNGGLPEYKDHILVNATDQDKPIKIWLTENTEKNDSSRTYALIHGAFSKKHFVRSDRNLPKEMQKQIACTFIKWLQNKTYSSHTLKQSVSDLDQFLRFCESLNVKSYKDIVKEDLYGFNAFIKSKISAKALREILEHLWEGLQIHHLRGVAFITTHKPEKQESEILKSDEAMDKLFEEKDYSDLVLMQLTALVSFHVDRILRRYEDYKNVNKADLKNDGVLFFKRTQGQNKYNTTGIPFEDKLKAIYENDEQEAINVIYKNMLLAAKSKKEGLNDFYATVEIADWLTHHSDKNFPIAERYRKFFINEYNISPVSKHVIYSTFLTEKNNIVRCVLETYLMLQTGVNYEVISSLKRSYRGVNWSERYDLFLGANEDTKAEKQVLRVSGTKAKGRHGTKEISIRVPVESHIYRVLKLTEEIFSEPNSDLFFPKTSLSYYNRSLCFLARNPIIDDGNELKALQSSRIRKTFAGVKLTESIEKSKSIGDLTQILRDAMDHENFDTTLFSYILKTGVFNYVYSHAVAALTTKMIEDCLDFKGKIIATDKSESSENADSTPVFLCECSDNTAPTHGVPINKRCTTYDLCLGCERSQVYSEHIPRICFRIMQYDNIPSPASDLIADRKAIAFDTLDRFRHEHPDGEQLLESSYAIASDAMINDKPLLPAIL